MSRMRLTQQEADPIGGITAAPIVVIGAVLAFGASVVLTYAHWSEVGSPLVALLGIVLVALAGLAAAISAAPSRAPFSAERLWLVVALAVGAAIAEYVSTIGADRYLYDDFGPIVIGMLILSLAPYCTWVSLILAGVLSAAVLSILVVGSATTTAIAPPLPRAHRGERRRGARHVGRRRRLLLRDRRRDARLAAGGEPGRAAPRCGAARRHRPIGAAEPGVGARARGAARSSPGS